MSKLLINEPPLMVLPKLAKAIGLNEAIVLQQLYYWLNHGYAAGLCGGELQTDNKSCVWYKNSCDGLLKRFPFLSKMTLRRTLTSLESQNLIISAKSSASKMDHRLSYSINYQTIENIEKALGCEQIDNAKMNTSEENQEVVDNKEDLDKSRSVQNEHIDLFKMNTSSLEKNVFNEDNKEIYICDSGNDFEKSGEANNERSNPTPKAPTRLDKLFNDFWTAYPNKKSKGEARDAFPKALSEAGSLDALLEAIKLQSEEMAQKLSLGVFCPEWPHAHRWLKKKRWLDEMEPSEGIKKRAERNTPKSFRQQDEERRNKAMMANFKTTDIDELLAEIEAEEKLRKEKEDAQV